MAEKIKSKWSSIPITVKVSTAYVICSILQRGLSFFTQPIFARLLTEEQYGLYIVYQSWFGILSIFITLNLAYGSFSKAMVKFENDRDGYISAVEGICVALSLAFLTIYLPFRKYWNMLFELPTMFVCIMIAEILGATAVQLWSGKKRFEFKYKSVVAVTLIISLLSPVLAYIMVVSTEEKGYARILGYSIVTIMVGGAFYAFNAVRGKKLLNKTYWKYGLQFNIPLLAYYLSQVIFNQSDRIMIDHLIGRDKAAAYGLAYSIAIVLTFVLNSINNSYVPWFYLKLKEGNPEENKKISLIIAVLMAVLLSGVIWMGPEIVMFIGGDKYAGAENVIPPVAVSLLLLFYAQLFINVEFYYEKKKDLVFASIGAAILNLVLNWIFIPRYGYVAAAYTTLVSYVVFAGSNYLAMKRILRGRNEEDRAYNYKWLIVVLVLFMVCSTVGALLYGFFWVRMLVALLAILIMFIYRNTLSTYVKMLFRKGEK